MRILKHSSFLLLSSLMACSGFQTQGTHKTVSKTHVHRQIAAMNEVLNDQEKLDERLDKLLNGVFHGHLLGQVYLNDFDAQLDKNPGSVLKSDTYASLLAVRTAVDEFEHQVNDLYLNLVLVSALPEYSPAQKLNAEFALNKIGSFLDGARTDKGVLPENLKPMVLQSLRDKQTELYEELKAMHDDSQFTNNDQDVKNVLHKNMVLLRATRKAFYKDMKNYHVDKSVLAQTLKEERAKGSFKKFEKDIKSLSKEMKAFTSELGRGTSSDAIYPSAGPNGNVTGRGFPANTWSLTYDDGPGKGTTQIVDNLKARNIDATFFMLTQQVINNPNTSKNVKESGFEIASHSWTHAQLTKVGPNQLEKEISTAKKTTEERLGVKIKLFRLPYGAGVSVSKIRSKIAENDMVHVFWNVDTLDWQDKNPTSVYNRAVKQMKASGKNAGVILFHDIHPTTVTASTMVMDYMNREGIHACSVSKVIEQQNNNLASCK